MFRLHIVPKKGRFAIVKTTASSPEGETLVHFALEEHARGWLDAHLRALNAASLIAWAKTSRITTPLPRNEFLTT